MAEYIEKKAIIEFIKKGLNNPDKQEAFGHDAVEILAEIEYMPAADVAEVKHSSWNEHSVGYSNVCLYCGAIVDRSAVVVGSGELNYCPNCGARMDGDGE